MTPHRARNAEGRMTIWGHLAELRRRLTIIVVAILATSMVFYFLAPEIIIFLLTPVARYFSNPNNLPFDEVVRQTYVLHALEAFTMRFFVGFVAAIVVTSPIWLWQIMGFFLPALKPNERRWVLPTFFAAVSLFIIGVVFCYTVILDPAFAFLLSQAERFGLIFPETSNYVDTVLLFLVAFGIAFELPVAIFYLTVFNVIPYKKLRKSWRVVYVVLLVLSAFITPDASPVTMILMFCALAVLYEASLFLARIVMSKRIKTLEEREAAEAAGEVAADAAPAKSKATEKASDAAPSKSKTAEKTSANTSAKSKTTEQASESATRTTSRATAAAKRAASTNKSSDEFGNA